MSAPDEQPVAIDQREKTRSAVPFLAAFGLALLVLVAVVLLETLRPAERNVTDSDKMATAVHDYTQAWNAADPAKLAAAVCPGFDPARSPLAAAAGKKADLVRLTDPSIDGDRGKVTVTDSVDGKESTATWALTRSGGVWRVCD
ncbi:hypothetical protein [Nocardia sp. alder85J]|uniref:Rv0361 family membrane protein n=1 Tax=Nocardia sp. alder85J TaxID=2862949 RepID=UPI001CD19F88|nr:hypothetical protein [Nocardia sp. alder85J]MCX4098941.1 hypothetical protein [Nocardia sp. alder85J]